MNTNFATLVAPLGCFSRSHGHFALQRETQSYIKDPRVEDSQASRRGVVSAILRSRRLDACVRAKIECHFYRFERVSSWHMLDDARKTEVVAEFFDSVRKAAAGIEEVVATTRTEREEHSHV